MCSKWNWRKGYISWHVCDVHNEKTSLMIFWSKKKQTQICIRVWDTPNKQKISLSIKDRNEGFYGKAAPNSPARVAIATLRTLHKWVATRPCGRWKRETWLAWKRSMLAATSLGVMKKTAAGDPFPGFRFQYQTSVLRECIYSCPACHDCFEWDWDSRPAER